MKRANIEENTNSQTSQLENPEWLQLNHNHKNFFFLTALLRFAQYKRSIGD
jgi:hypothetical protein